MVKKLTCLFLCFALICFPSSMNVFAEECEHSYGAWGVRVLATCTRDGYKLEFCVYCDYENKVITDPAFGHTEVIDEGVPATCETTGLTEGTHCSVCDEVLVAQQTIEATGHNWTLAATTLEPTCVDSGINSYVCANDSSHTKTEVISPLGHNYQSVVTSPDCTQEGYTTHTCVTCSDSYTDNTTAPLGHSFGDWEVSVNASCTESGLEICYCETCGETQTRVTEKTAHTFIDGRCSGCKRLLGDGNINDELEILDLIFMKNTLVDTPDIYDPFLDMNFDSSLNAADLISLKKILFENF